jgi:hypothetical protein
MNADEATALAAKIDKSHLPVHVKQVTCNGIVMIQDDNTGYTLPILSNEHWQQYAKQQGDSNAIDEFVGAGVSLMAQLETMIASLTTERDALMAQAEQVDNQITRLSNNKNVIEAAIMAVDNVSLNASLRGVTVAPVTASPKRRSRSFSSVTQRNWVIEKLSTSEPVRVSTLADEWANHANVSREQAIKSLSGTLSRLTKEDMQYERVALGTYQYSPAPVEVQDER